MRDGVREYVLEHPHDEGAVLVAGEPGDVKKGAHTVGVQRQYTGTAGRIENAHVAVDLVYAGLGGHAAVDRELYIPRSRACDADRCQAAGLGEDTVFADKPELAARMTGRSPDCRAPRRLGREQTVYGGNPKLRSALEERQVGYVLTVACSHEVTTEAGEVPRGYPGREGAQASLAEAAGRGRCQRGTASTTGPSSTWPNPVPAAASC